VGVFPLKAWPHIRDAPKPRANLSLPCNANACAPFHYFIAIPIRIFAKDYCGFSRRCLNRLPSHSRSPLKLNKRRSSRRRVWVMASDFGSSREEWLR